MNQKKYNVGIVCAGLGATNPGAVANVALKHAELLCKQFNVRIFSEGFSQQYSPLIKTTEISSPSYTWLRRFAHVPREAHFAKKALTEIHKAHDSKPFDILICHSHVVANLALKPVKKTLSIPFILIAHGDIFDRPKGTYDARLSAFYKYNTRPAYRSADSVITLSPYTQNRAIDQGANPNRTVVIPNGIAAQDIGLNTNIEKQALSSSSFRLCYLGRLSKEKGVHLLIESCTKLKANNINFTLAVYGSGDQKPLLQTLVNKGDLSSQISFYDPVKRSHTAQIYTSAHLCVVPSLSDTFPTVILESMLCGTPVLASNIGGISHMIEHEVNGLLTKPTPEAFCEAIIHANEHRPKLAQMGATAAKHIEKHFAWPHIGQQLTRHISHIISVTP